MFISQILQSSDHLSICSREDLLQRCKDDNHSETIPIQLIFEEYSKEQGQTGKQWLIKITCKPWREINCRKEWGKMENKEHL
jgi:hypothetical protein